MDTPVWFIPDAVGLNNTCRCINRPSQGNCSLFIDIFGLTCLLSEGGGLALAVFRHGDHADVVVDARLQAVHGVLAGRGQDKVLGDGDALAHRRDGDLVARDGGGVEGRPPEADAGVAHVLEGDVGHLRHFYGGERLVGKGWGGREEKKNGNTNKREEGRGGRV